MVRPAAEGIIADMVMSEEVIMDFADKKRGWGKFQSVYEQY